MPINPIVGASLVSGASSAINYGLNLASQNASAKTNYKYSKKMADYNQGIWEKQFGMSNARQDDLNANQYKTMVDSMRNAGLSPLWTGQQPIVAGATSPTGGNGSVSGSPFGQQIQFDPMAFAQLRLAQKQGDLIDAQVDQTKEQTNLTKKNVDAYDKVTQSLLDLQEANKLLVDEQRKQLPREVDNAIQQRIDNYEINFAKVSVDQYGIDTQRDIASQNNAVALKLQELQGEVAKYVSDNNLEAARTSAAATVQAAKLSADASKYSANKLASVQMYGNETQRRQAAGAFMSDMCKAGFTPDDAEKMALFIMTGDSKSFKEQFGERVSENANSAAILANNFTEAQTSKVGWEKWNLGTQGIKNLTGAANDLSNILSDWVPNPKKVVETFISRTNADGSVYTKTSKTTHRR